MHMNTLKRQETTNLRGFGLFSIEPLLIRRIRIFELLKAERGFSGLDGGLAVSPRFSIVGNCLGRVLVLFPGKVCMLESADFVT